MAFKIIPKIKADKLQDRSLDIKMMDKYYKAVQKVIIQKTSPEVPTDYYWCNDYAEGDSVFVFGTHNPTFKKVFKETAKGQHGFEKTNISIGECFALKENEQLILCVRHNATQSKGKTAELLRAFKKLLRKQFKGFADVRLIEGALVADADGKGHTEVEPEPTTTASSTTATGGVDVPPVVSREEIEKRGKQLQEGIKKLKNDVVPRFKKNETGKQDAAFVQALRKAASVWLAKLAQADSDTASKASDQQEKLQRVLPQWQDLENRIANNKTKSDSRKARRATVKEMNQKRKRIKQLLKKVDLKAFS